MGDFSSFPAPSLAAPGPFPGDLGYRGHKGPNPDNTSGFRATGHRVLLRPDPIETTTASGIVLTAKIVQQNKTKCTYATVLEVGHDAWMDKSTDFCQVGDRVMVGEHTGVFQTSPVDGLEYRFINDLDIITPIIEPNAV